MGSAFGCATQSKISATTVNLEGKMRSTTLEYAPPEVVTKMENLVVTPSMQLTLETVDVYCWAMSFYALLSNKSYGELKSEYIRYKMKTEEIYKNFTKRVESIFTPISPKNSTESSMKEAVKEILFDALKFAPKERPKMKEIISKMRELENAKKIVLNYSQAELDNNNNIASLLMLEKAEQSRREANNKDEAKEKIAEKPLEEVEAIIAKKSLENIKMSTTEKPLEAVSYTHLTLPTNREV
eukprot:TRINITY_DN17153_c0_g1_i1.p1 TRINITY_DN17153_c0_g1~~TRINITY_DN17153_c0_g1_i1.p1  ORF type:complete len:283 (-),score=69.30 TRINITY_DN17153_c0_g1_i1:39-761(-)